jgi:hypothetical protein
LCVRERKTSSDRERGGFGPIRLEYIRRDATTV